MNEASASTAELKTSADTGEKAVLQGIVWKALGGKELEVGSRTEAIVERKKLQSSCYDRKCRQMCFLTICSAGNEIFFDLYLMNILAAQN